MQAYIGVGCVEDAVAGHPNANDGGAVRPPTWSPYEQGGAPALAASVAHRGTAPLLLVYGPDAPAPPLAQDVEQRSSSSSALGPSMLRAGPLAWQRRSIRGQDGKAKQ